MGTGVYILVTSGQILLATLGPVPGSLRECTSRIELWTKLFMIEPRLPGVPEYETTYQCVEMTRPRKERR
jgi:hypothetical protein